MSKIFIDLDDELVAKSQEILGVQTKEEAVNGAMRELVRRAAVEDFLEMARGGALHDLADPDVMARAGR